VNERVAPAPDPQHRLTEALRRVDARDESDDADTVAAALVDSAGLLVAATAPLERLIGSTIGAMAGSSVLDLLHSDDLDAAVAAFARTTAFAGPKVPYDLRIRHHDGTFHDYEVLADSFIDTPAIDGVLLRLTDPRHRAIDDRLSRAHAVVLERIAAAASLVSIAEAVVSLVELDGDVRVGVALAADGERGRVVVAPGVAEAHRLVLTSAPQRAFPWEASRRGQSVFAALDGPDPGADIVPPTLIEALLEPGFRFAWAQPVLLPGDPFSRPGCVFVLSFLPGRPSGTLARLVDLGVSLLSLAMASASRAAALAASASVDDLTGHGNRRALLDTAGRVEHVDSMVAAFGLRQFELFADTHGPIAAEELLRLVATQLSSLLPKATRLCRIDRDEFAVVLPVTHLPATPVHAIIDQVLVGFNAPLQLEDQLVFVDLAIGTTDSGGTPMERYRQATIALHQAKSQPRRVGQVAHYSDDVAERRQRHIEIEHALRNGLPDGVVTAKFQAHVNLASDKVVGAEALARWVAPGRWVSPAEFIPVAESAGLIDRMGEVIVRDVCRVVTEWQVEGHTQEQFRFWVNVSPTQLADPTFPERFLRTLELWGTATHAVGIEITETEALTGEGVEREGLQRLTEKGVAVALDDFGTGYANMALLATLPLHAVKIDRSMIEPALVDPRHRRLVEAVTVLAHDLGFIVVAEGVETSQQASMLSDVGCDLAQGFLYSPAVDASLLLGQVLARRDAPG